MKKLLILVAALAGAATVNARVFGFGIKAGLDMPKVSTDIASATTNLSFGGFHAGVLAEFIIPVVGIGIQPELLYVNKQVSGMDKRTHTFEIPLNISWGINLPVLNLRPFVLVAPTFSYAFKKMSGVSVDGNPTGVSIPTFTRNNWGIAVGAGLDIWKLQVMLKYKWGVNEMSELSNIKFKENVLTLSIGYFIF